MSGFTEEQNIFRGAYRRFLEVEIVPNMDQWREDGIIDKSAYKKAGENGFLVVWADEKYGGLGDNDFRYEQILVQETIRAGCREFFNSFHGRVIAPYFERFGTEEQKERFLSRAVSGDAILAIAMTEPGGGSDLKNVKTVAKDCGDHYLLNGSKIYISNGINSGLVIVLAKIADASDPYSMVLLVVEEGMTGFVKGRNLKKLGLPAQDTAELFFSDVKVPKSNVLGKPGSGFKHVMQGLAEERLLQAIITNSSARKMFDMTREFCRSRIVMGEQLSSKQNTQFQMADMDSQIDMASVYIDKCIEKVNNNELSSGMAAKAKLLSSEIEWKMADLALQLHGGAGYMCEYPISQMFVNSRLNRITAGSSEIMKYIIGRECLSDKYVSPLD